MNNLKPILNNLNLWVLVSLTLGLAPFLPEPHVVGKIRWVLGGATGMTGTDWFDLLLHLTPWLLLVRILVLRIRHNLL
ncbi:hypothetical protein [Spirosoma spitsbergense]|uniref:hypothetical protein n=1 Tax=Spirosoma spitsbergense TaxID=431554 RepID=UPI00037141F1|nr:hypothetical protein [Spirosoma spitsbergense]